MTFIEPALKEVFNTISNNDELITFLKEKEYLLTPGMLYDTYTVEQLKNMEAAIVANNTETIYNLSQVLLNNSEEIKSNDIWYLISNMIAYDEIAAAFGLSRDTFSIEAYKLIVYTYKFCYINSFFQNNKDVFLPEYDFSEIENTPILKGFLDAMMKEFDKLDYVIGKCTEFHDFDKIPFELINYLTQLLGFETAIINADNSIESKYRELVRNIIDIYRIKGTNFSFELLFKFLGYNISIKEFYFDRRYYYSSEGGNTNTNTTDNNNYLYYMSIYPPCDNKLETSNNETVNLFDYTQQYNLDEFSMLAKKYGPAAVLGYSKVDKAGKEYTGKIYKYFKSNLIYYTVGLDKANPSEKQLVQINKILTFLTPAYVMKTMNVNVYTGSSSTAPSDNMIFFDDNRTLDNTLVNLEEEVTQEESFEIIREEIRKKYPIMLDSEMRDDTATPKKTNMNLYVDEEGNITHDDGSKSPYINTINTSTFKPKVASRFEGKICLNRYSGNNYYNFITVRNEERENNLSINIDYTDKTIEDYISEQRLTYSISSINTLTLLEKAQLENLQDLKNRYDCCLTINRNIELNNFIAPTRLGKQNVEKMSTAKCVFIISNGEVGVYKFGAVPSTNSKYGNSFVSKLVRTQKLYITSGKKVNLNVPEDLKVEKLNLEELYNEVKKLGSIESIKRYYYDASENYWYYPIKKANLGSRISNGRYYRVNDVVLPIGDQVSTYGIPEIYKLEDGTFYPSRPKEDVVVTGYSTVEECLNVMRIDIYNNFCFYIVDVNNDYESNLYKFNYSINNEFVYSSADEKLYRINQSNYEEIKNFFGKLVIEDDTAKLYEYDESWNGYDEIDDYDNYIWYNNQHRIIWKYLGFDKVISRPVKELTDKEVDKEDAEHFKPLRDLLINEIVYSTFQYFQNVDKNFILEKCGGNLDGFLQAIKEGNITNKQEIVNYLRDKISGSKKDVYGNYNELYGLLYDFLSSEDLEEFIKWYYYDKLTKLYREAYFKDEAESADYRIGFSDFERIPIYETLNGNMGILKKPNTLLQSRVGTSSLNLNYTISNGNIIVSKEELIKNNLLVFVGQAVCLQEIRNIKLIYGTKSVFIYNITTALDNNRNLIISCDLPEDVKNGYLEVNNTIQTLQDNKINGHTSSYIEEGDFVTLGDDRVLDISGKVNNNIEIVSDKNETLVLLPSGYLFSDLYSIEVEISEDMKRIKPKNIKSYGFVKMSNIIFNKFKQIDKNKITVDVNIYLQGLSIR